MSNKEQDRDFFIEPPEAVQALFANERFVGSIYDPACGTGTIPKIATQLGYDAFGSDIVRRGYGVKDDFLDVSAKNRRDVHNVICNPPYSLAEKFIRRAHEITHFKIAMLLRLSFLEGERRGKGLHRQFPPARVLIFSNRINMPPGQLLLEKKVEREGGKIAFAWFVWSLDHSGPPSIRWITSKAPT